jgi:hypothetical protein
VISEENFYRELESGAPTLISWGWDRSVQYTASSIIIIFISEESNCTYSRKNKLLSIVGGSFYIFKKYWLIELRM